MRRLTRREIILLSATGVLALAYAWYASQKAVGSLEADARLGSSVSALAETAPRVPMDLLTAGADEYDPNGRDLFKYGQRGPSPEELARLERERLERERLAALRAEAEKKRAAAENAKKTPPQPSRPAQPRPPRIGFAYIGYLGPKDDRIAVFAAGQEVLLAKQGEVLQEQFRVMEIRYDTVVMGFTDPKYESNTEELSLKN